MADKVTVDGLGGSRITVGDTVAYVPPGAHVLSTSKVKKIEFTTEGYVVETTYGIRMAPSMFVKVDLGPPTIRKGYVTVSESRHDRLCRQEQYLAWVRNELNTLANELGRRTDVIAREARTEREPGE